MQLNPTYFTCIYLGLRRQHEVVCEHRPRALSRQGDPVWVPSEGGGVGAGPLQGGDEVAEAKVGREGRVV